LAVRTKPQAPRPLLQWLASSFEAGIVRESQEVNRRMLKLPWRIALNPANAELEWQPYQKKAY
jgi:hypothetical protein